MNTIWGGSNYHPMSITLIIAGFLLLAAGLGVGYYIARKTAESRAESKEAKAQQKVMDAKSKAKEIVLEAKEKSIEIIDEAKEEEQKRKKEIEKAQNRVEKQEKLLQEKEKRLEEEKEKIENKVEEIEKLKEELKQKEEEKEKKLQEISGYSKEQAKNIMFNKLEEEASEELLSRKLKLDRQNDEEVERKAREILIDAMERTASSHAQDATSTEVELPNDEMKGRIIGKEGRNIKTIEKLTGCELIIDDTPESIMISGFSPIRRRICYIALKKLIKDGRIQPARIEKYVKKAKQELAKDIRKTGEEALHELGIIDVEPQLTSIVGRLKYRTSYGQEQLTHSKEVAYLSEIIADELGMDSEKAKKAGFFHDIGKALDHETEGTHTKIGYTVLKKFNMGEDIAEVAMTHHDSNPPLLLTKIVMAADAISASRAGARNDSFEEYIERLENLEETAGDFPGVEKAYAIEAGQEVRVFVTPEEVDDYDSYNLAKEIAQKIESDLTYPGEIKVTMIRESRIIEYAR